jgi:hypothetical protein
MIKKVGIGIGALLLLGLMLWIVINDRAIKFTGDHKQFIKEFTVDFSENWNVEDVKERCTVALLQQIHTPNGVAALDYFSRLGKLVAVKDYQLINYHHNFTGANTGVLAMKAEFESGEAMVTAIILQDGSISKINEYYIRPVNEPSGERDVAA